MYVLFTMIGSASNGLCQARRWHSNRNNSTYKQFKITQHLCGGIWCCGDNQGQIAQKSAYYLKSSMETYMGKEIPWKTERYNSKT